uniref:Syndecan n=1 Tax=Macaca fascicularis TaxID=9541 RepID=A0A7N9IH44_MACFA
AYGTIWAGGAQRAPSQLEETRGVSVCVCPSVEGPIAPGPPPCPRKRSPRELGVLRTWSALRVHAQRALQTRARGLTAAPSVPLPGSASAPRARAEGGAPRPHYPGISRAERPGTTTCGNHSSRRRGGARRERCGPNPSRAERNPAAGSGLQPADPAALAWDSGALGRRPREHRAAQPASRPSRPQPAALAAGPGSMRRAALWLWLCALALSLQPAMPQIVATNLPPEDQDGSGDDSDNFSGSGAEDGGPSATERAAEDGASSQLPAAEGSGEQDFTFETSGENTAIVAVEPDHRNQSPVDPGATGASQGLLDRKEVLGGIIAGGLVGLIFAVCLVGFMLYRMKKKDEGSYSLEEPKQANGGAYQKPTKQEEFYA